MWVVLTLLGFAACFALGYVSGSFLTEAKWDYYCDYECKVRRRVVRGVLDAGDE